MENTTDAINASSSTGLIMQFDETNKILTIQTPGGNSAILSDKEQSIVLKDQNGNLIKMTADGITISSIGDLNLSAEKNINITANTGINVQASAGDVSIKGLNIKEQADMAYSAQGSATASVQGGATLTLKAAMVMIN